MTIRLNDAARELPEGGTLADLLSQLGLQGGPGFAIAVNGSVAPRSSWPSHELRQGDEVLVIRATQGG